MPVRAFVITPSFHYQPNPPPTPRSRLTPSAAASLLSKSPLNNTAVNSAIKPSEIPQAVASAIETPVCTPEFDYADSYSFAVCVFACLSAVRDAAAFAQSPYLSVTARPVPAISSHFHPRAPDAHNRRGLKISFESLAQVCRAPSASVSSKLFTLSRHNTVYCSSAYCITV